MSGVVPVSKFDKAFRVVPVTELGVPLKGRRVTAEDETGPPRDMESGSD